MIPSVQAPRLLAPPRRVWAAGRTLGEGAWWSVEESALYWVDIKNPAILRLVISTGERTVWPMVETIGCCAPLATGGLMAAMASGIYRLQLGMPGEMPARELLYRPTAHGPRDRFNDGKVHPDGSFWSGTMDDAELEVRGYFHRLGPEGSAQVVAGPFVVCNGPAFSPDGAVVYLVDSAGRTVLRQQRGDQDVQLFLRFGEDDGYPDGCTTDRDGRLWVAFWDGACVACFDPDSGARLLTIPMPVARPTSCAFGGPDLATLFVTCAINPAGVDCVDPGGDLYAIELEGACGWRAPVCTIR